MNSIAFEEMLQQSGWVQPRTQYYRLKISAHTIWDEFQFNVYSKNKNIIAIDKENLKNILLFCDVREPYMLNEFFIKLYGARYVGYSYFFDWTQPNNNADYKYYFNIKHKKKFNYARIKLGF